MAYTMRVTGGRGRQGAVPTNATLPAPSGTPTVGQTLTAPAGTWTGYPVPWLVSRQWVRGAATDIPGATGVTYTLVGADATNTIRCRVTMSNGIGDVTATSAPTATVAA